MEYYFFYYELNPEESPTQIRDELINYHGKRTVFDLSKIICEEQVRIAVERSIRAEKRKKMIAKTWGIEILLHLAGTHQISEALSILNISDDTSMIGIIQDTNIVPIPGAIPEFPQFDELLKNIDKQKLYSIYKIAGKDPCSEIISKGVNVVLDHE